LLQALDVLVVNSHQEPFALTVLEGLASGTAVLATAVGGTPEMVRHDQNGWLVQSGNQDELSAGLITLMNDTDLRARLGSLARHDATARYSTSRFLTEVTSLYREILNDCHIPQQKNLPNLEVSLSSD
jgi:glycosyltransferase involved in cell wall biosynthesis